MSRHHDSTKETVQHKVNTSLRFFINRLHADFPAHWHTDIEIIWPKEAPYRVVCANQEYYVDIDDILLICPTVLHEIYSLSPGNRVYIQADMSGLGSFKEIDRAFYLMYPALHIKKATCPSDIYDYLCNCINEIMEVYFGSAPPVHIHEEEMDDVIAFTELAPYDELEIYATLMKFIAFCGKNINLFRSSESSSSHAALKNYDSLDKACAYITEHFTEELTLEKVASYAGFSKYHFERIFSDYTGMTFYQYLQQARINYAVTLLSNPELTVTDISYQAGFASCNAFTRAFKKSTGCPPSQFRILNEVRHPLSANEYFAQK
ncbi:helix-turn-helix transcriptional regulator [Pseudobutyrivibrio ruminis]|uniref:AraC-type DNA-binding protein n=1 Tax=Pseudobutyrivibrio ruminis DSM 9787 TaxID=1123011 RepID=A0A285SLM7_9FIRM|nr:AraC family transcriptional regulator [Pseudobutyrivibrio ruminis]SOC08598.1 AraC-type DNA-binding protein [Pseudobutyrivibrio ruminis DSM 9787]